MYGPAAEPVIVHVPVAVNVTVPPEMLHTPDTALVGVIPVVEPVTAEMLEIVGV